MKRVFIFLLNLPIVSNMAKSKSIFNIFIFFLLVGTAGCGKISDVVSLNYGPQGTADTKKSSPFFGLSSAAGIRSSGSFELNGGLGNQVSSALKSSGGFTLYGGIQGQVVSQ